MRHQRLAAGAIAFIALVSLALTGCGDSDRNDAATTTVDGGLGATEPPIESTTIGEAPATVGPPGPPATNLEEGVEAFDACIAVPGSCEGAILNFLVLSDRDLSGVDLSGARLSGADLSRSDLSGANLSGADLSGAELVEADLSGADLSRANLKGAILTDAAVDDATRFDGTIFCQTTMPDGSENDELC